MKHTLTSGTLSCRRKGEKVMENAPLFQPDCDAENISQVSKVNKIIKYFKSEQKKLPS